MKMVFLLLLSLLPFASGNNVLARVVIGQVFDETTGLPLRDVSVIILESADTSVTGSDGYYYFPNIADGSYTLLVGGSNYKPLILNSVPLGSCCQLRGNLNDLGTIDITDLTYLVSYMFRGGPPPLCFEHGDVNASGAIDVVDLTALVDYMFRSGPAPMPAPSYCTTF